MTTEAPKAPTPAEATIKAAYLEELRFAKRQQWTITAAVVAFIAGAYSVTHQSLDFCWEKVVAAGLIWIVVGFSIYWLFDLQDHLHRTRLIIDPYDATARHRGLEIVYGMAGALILSAIVVCFLLFHDMPECGLGVWTLLIPPLL
jgi:hypothetical protein